MDLADLLPKLLAVAWLLPLVSFTIIVFFGPRLGKHGVLASYVATGAILGGFVLSSVALIGWVSKYGGSAPGGHHETHDAHGGEHHGSAEAESDFRLASSAKADAHGDEHHTGHVPAVYTNVWYTLGRFGDKSIDISYYIDGLTVVMFWMVTLIASCIHFYAIGYMHDELHDITDHEVLVTVGSQNFRHAHGHGHDAHGHGDHGHGHDSHGAQDVGPAKYEAPSEADVGKHPPHPAPPDVHEHLHADVDHPPAPVGKEYLHRPGRFYRFFQYLSLFCFSMLGLVIAGNIAQVFVFWELVGVCSYFLIGFYIERKSASNAANKAFIVNRVGDFGMIIGLMALWGSLGTFAFGDMGGKPGLFSQIRPASHDHALIVPDAMVRESATKLLPAETAVTAAQINEWRSEKYGYWLLVVAGLGIFCGCVGKSAQFPLHVWLPDAMEGPTPVSALVHSATMVAAGVYLVGRFYPVFAPEVLLVIGYIGGITLFLAATIAITATDIKRVLAYSTVSQLGYMMLALGIGGWAAGLFHLITHAFFKSLLFMCSGSVIHATHTNDMMRMGGLRRKMPWTAYTMLVGCLAIIGAGVPFVLGFSGYYSKDAIIAQGISFAELNPRHSILLYAACGGAAITAFYMFRLWYLTFAGQPRDQHVFDHAHESPKIMYLPLVVLSLFAIGVGWPRPFLFADLSLPNLLEQARPAGEIGNGVVWAGLHYPNEHASHAPAIHVAATLIAFSTALGGFVLATIFYGLRKLSAAEVRHQFEPLYTFLWHKWYFDELYHFLFIRPTHFVSGLIAKFDKQGIDVAIDKAAGAVRGLSRIDDAIDRTFVDGLVNLVGNWTYSIGRSLKAVQTGRLRQYVMLIVVGVVALTMIMQMAFAGG
jgi:NADH-quinone oxidoreductase subunit L